MNHQKSYIAKTLLTIMIFSMLALISCSKDEPYDHNKAMRVYYIGPETLTRDTGITWQITEALVNLSGWNQDSNRYIPSNYRYIKFSDQYINFKKQGNGGTYQISDSVALLLRTAMSGRYTTHPWNDRTKLTVEFSWNSNAPWLVLSKGDLSGPTPYPNSLLAWTKYSIGTIEYYIQFHLVY